MKIALFGKKFNDDFKPVILALLSKLAHHHAEVFIYQPFYDFVNCQVNPSFTFTGYFTHHSNLPKDMDVMISIGGDGTFLEAITLIRDYSIPLVGINSGRLGFLANIAAQDADLAMEKLFDRNYSIENRNILELKSNHNYFSDFPFALNECTIQKVGSGLITIHVTINDEYLSSYWADGIIVSTPTGSTAYSLSLGGPIVTPQSNIFLITPIAAHNLNVRPLVIPDDAVLKLSVEGRSNKFLATLDSRSTECEIENEITIAKANFKVQMIKLPQTDFYSTLRNKLIWGADKRN
jgi:NAD+ kinase